jgi:MYXO-CTERM domain-containing protein
MRQTIMALVVGVVGWVWQAPVEGALVMSSSGTFRFEWVDLRDSGGNSLTTLPVGMTATSDATSFGWADRFASYGSGSQSVEYYRNGVLLSPGYHPQSPFLPGDVFESTMQADATFAGCGWVDVGNTTWSTLYIHNETTETYTAEFSIDYTYSNSAQGAFPGLTWNSARNFLGITVNYDYPNSSDDFDDWVAADGASSGSRHADLVLSMEPGWTVVDLIRWNGNYAEAVPEPSTGVLGLVGVGAVFAWRRRLARS